MLSFSINSHDWRVFDKQLGEYIETTNRNRWLLDVYESCDKPRYYNKTYHKYVSREEEISDRIFQGLLKRHIVKSFEINHPNSLKGANQDINKEHYTRMEVFDGYTMDAIDSFLVDAQSKDPLYIEPDSTLDALVYAEVFDYLAGWLTAYTEYRILAGGAKGYNILRRMINADRICDVAKEFKLFLKYVEEQDCTFSADGLWADGHAFEYCLQRFVEEWGIASNVLYKERAGRVSCEEDVAYEEELRLQELQRLKDTLYLDWGILDFVNAGIEPPTELIEKIQEYQKELKRARDRERLKAKVKSNDDTLHEHTGTSY